MRARTQLTTGRCKALLLDLRSNDQWVAERAITLLKAERDTSIIKPLLRHALDWRADRDHMRYRAARVLKTFGECAVIRQTLLAALEGTGRNQRIAAAWTMGEVPQFGAIAELKRLIRQEKE